MSKKQKPLLTSNLKLVLLGIVAASFIIAAKYFNVQTLFHNSLLWVNNLGIFAPIAFIIIYNLATLLFVPGSLLTIKGGCFFGLFWGSLYVIIAATFGAVVAFLVGRYLSRDWVCKKLSNKPKFQAVDKAVAKQGFKIVLLTRLSPIFPFNLLNYAFGVTQVSLKDYTLGSIGMIPGTILYVYIGSLAGDIATITSSSQPSTPETEIAKWILQAVGLIASIAVTIYITKVAQKALHDSVAEMEVNADIN
ncbi:MAG: TVP38/TMEM64 family protein [Cyanobacteria bacterium P01_A01_bin.84]